MNKETSKQNKEAKNIAQSGPPKNLLIPVLLLHLHNWNRHGYELIQQLTLFGFQNIDQGNIYRTLRQLEKENYIHSSWATPSSGPAKRIYSLTKAGEEYLKMWVDSLEEYQKLMQQFFSMYSSMFLPTFPSKHEQTEEKQENNVRRDEDE